MLYKINPLSLFVLSVFLFGCGDGGGSSDESATADAASVDITTEDNSDSSITDENSDSTTTEDNSAGSEEESTTPPNILFIISDDQGLDASAQYNLSNNLPNTPTLNKLAAEGLTFENMWVTPACSTTRATIITGKYGINNGIESLPANLSTDQEILQKYLKNNEATSQYESAVFGKWHLATGRGSDTHPNDMGVDYYAGNISNLTDYYNWSININGTTENTTQYHTSYITNLAIDWIGEQNAPWFAWLAYSAPHSPFHLPPESLHDRDLSGTDTDITNNTREYYLAAIEAMDKEIGRLLDGLDDETRENTIVIFIGDNGTPAGVIDEIYSSTHAKGSLYQGGIATPFVISGKGVTRINEREGALITATDLFATIANIAGGAQTKIEDSESFKSLLSDDTALDNGYIYTAFASNDVTGSTARNEEYKLIEFSDGSQELYALAGGFEETNDLLPTSDPDLLAEIEHLENFISSITGDNSDTPVDITNVILQNKSENCVDYIEQFTTTVNDVKNGVVFYGDLVISQVGNKCIFKTNAIPNHDFNDGGSAFPNDVSEQNDIFEITVSPTKASVVTPISLTVDNAILLNGVKVDLLAAGCFGVGNGKVGCNDMNQPWRYDPMHAENGFNVDSHNAHAQPDGTYHYHGSPVAMFADSNDSGSPIIGFSADGFPIFGSYFDDEGSIRKATSSYRLKEGNRPSGSDDPGGSYDGAFREDYEYIEGVGDLDECNGMTLNGVYGYYITDSYPYVLACFVGTPDASFNK